MPLIFSCSVERAAPTPGFTSRSFSLIFRMSLSSKSSSSFNPAQPTTAGGTSTRSCFRAMPNRIDAGWRETRRPGHFVQIYDQADHLITALAGFIADGLWQGERALVFATREHRSELEHRLRDAGVDVTSAVVTRQYIALDAEETLARIMVGSRPDPELFEHVIGSLIRRATRGGRALIAFGELVTVCLAGGNSAGALQLEELWNRLAREVEFTLFCAYPTSCFAQDVSGRCLADICRAHTQVIPPDN